MTMKPIGFVSTESEEKCQQNWTVSGVEGKLVIREEYRQGLKDLKAGQRIVVIFHFDQSPEFTLELLVQQPHHRDQPKGVFSTLSPIRPNPIGMSILDVLDIKDNVIHVRGIDMLDKTPILDIKPYIDLTFP